METHRRGIERPTNGCADRHGGPRQSRQMGIRRQESAELGRAGHPLPQGHRDREIPQPRCAHLDFQDLLHLVGLTCLEGPNAQSVFWRRPTFPQ
jgi:hypothetical protein